MEILVGRRGTQRTPITDPSVSREHCKLTSNADGTYILENISANGTFVNGTGIIRTVVTPDTIIRLGANYTITVSDLLPMNAAKSRASQQARPQDSPIQQSAIGTEQQCYYQREFRKLKAVYDRYSEQKIAIQREAGMTNFYRMLPMTLLAIVSMGASFIPGLGDIAPVIACIGLGLLVYSLFKSYSSSSKNPQKMEALNKQFMIDYVCPKCGNFLGFTPFEALENKSTCNYCKCKWS